MAAAGGWAGGTGRADRAMRRRGWLRVAFLAACWAWTVSGVALFGARFAALLR